MPYLRRAKGSLGSLGGLSVLQDLDEGVAIGRFAHELVLVGGGSERGGGLAFALFFGVGLRPRCATSDADATVVGELRGTGGGIRGMGFAEGG